MYHLKETVGALEILKSIEPTSCPDQGQEAIMSSLEQALNVLPCPPPASVTPSEAATESTPELSQEEENEN